MWSLRSANWRWISTNGTARCSGRAPGWFSPDGLRRLFDSAGLPADATAVVTSPDFGGTVDLARRLQPEARRILVVSGASDLDRRNEHQARRVLSNETGALPFEFLIGLPLPELVSRVAAEPADTIVLYSRSFATGWAGHTRRAKSSVP